MTFLVAYDRLIGAEGGYVNNPKDPGGETNWGISKRAYPDLDIKALTRGQARDIYKRDFWDRCHADELPWSVAFQAFDFAVNSGIETAVRYLQRALEVADDGHWGPVTRAAAVSIDEPRTLMRLNGLRIDYMTRLKNWDNASRGWARRIGTNLLYGADDYQHKEK